MVASAGRHVATQVRNTAKRVLRRTLTIQDIVCVLPELNHIEQTSFRIAPSENVEKWKRAIYQ